MIAEDFKPVYSRAKWLLILRGLLSIAVGVLIIARPLASVATLALVIALWAVVDGIANVTRAFVLRRVAPHWGVFLGVGIIGILFGAAALYYYPALSLAFAVTWAALWLIVGGSAALYIGLQERKLGISFGWTMALGVIGIIAGILAFAYPQITLVALMGLIAVFGIVGGIAMLAGAAKLASIEGRVEQMAADVHSSERKASDVERDDTRGSHAA